MLKGLSGYNISLVDKRVEGFSPLWFEPSSGHMWESQVCLRMVRWFFSGYSGFRPPSMNDRLDISVKGP